MEESSRKPIDQGRLEALIVDLTRDAQVRLNTNIPGIVTEWDPVEQLATVKSVFKIRINGEIEEITPLVKVPVRFMRGGNFCLTFPVKPGDEVQLKAQQRSIVKWLVNGDAQDPANSRLHDISDVIASLDMYCQPRKIESVDVDACELRTLDGKIKIRIADDAASVETEFSKILVKDNEITATCGITGIDMLLDDTGAFNVTNTTAELVTAIRNAIFALENLTTTNGGTINPAQKAVITLARQQIESFQ